MTTAIERKRSAGTAKQPLRKSVGIWIRVSTEDQARGESPKHHEERARRYAQEKSWDVVRVYDLSGVSGKTVVEHPEARAMREDIKAGRISGLIFSKLARLARNTRELLDFAEYFKEHDADLVSLQECIDTSTPAGRFFYTMIAGMAQWEREEIADRVAASVRVRATLGKSLGGAAPFGYRWEQNQLVPDAGEAPVRKRLYELFREHGRLKTVARLLNEAGHRTRQGARFSDTTVRRLIENPTAKGQRRSNYTRSLGDKKHWVKKGEEDWVWTTVEPVVSEDLWDECLRLLKERNKGRRPPRRAVHLFTGVAHCHCGKRMYVPSNTPKYVCFDCRNKIPVDDLEQVFVSQLKAFFLSPADVRRHLAAADDTLATELGLLENLEGERQKIQAEMDKLYQLYVGGEIAAEGFGRRNRPLEERLAQIEDEIPRLRGRIDFLKIRHASEAEVMTEGQAYSDHWPKLPFDQRRRMVETIVERVTVGKDDVAFDLNFVPATPETAVNWQRANKGSSPPPASSTPDTSSWCASARW